MKKFIRLNALPHRPVPAALDQRILGAARIKAVGWRQERQWKQWTWAAAAAVLLVGLGFLSNSWPDESPASRVKLAQVSRSELLQLGDFSGIDQESYNMYCEAASQTVAWDNLNQEI